MSKITIEFTNHKVEYYNIPYALARAIPGRNFKERRRWAVKRLANITRHVATAKTVPDAKTIRGGFVVNDV